MHVQKSNLHESTYINKMSVNMLPFPWFIICH